MVTELLYLDVLIFLFLPLQRIKQLKSKFLDLKRVKNTAIRLPFIQVV